MERCKEFFRNITKTGWIVISLVIVLILLVIIGVLLSKKGVDLWPFNNSKEDNLVVDEGINEEFMAGIENTISSSKDTVLSVEDVLEGKYNNSVASATLYVQNTTEVKVAVVIDEEQHQIEGLEQKECGKFAFVTVRVPNNPGIINETLKALFKDNVVTDFMPGNTIVKYNPDLVFDNAVLEDGVAKIYLRGDFGEVEGEGCVTELAITQIEETVKQFDTVNLVEIYLNLEKVN